MNRKILTAILKIAVSVGIVTNLVWNACKPNADGVNVFDKLRHEPKHWAMLAAAFVVFTAGIMCTFVRWRVLVRALGVPARLRDTIRVGFWGFLFNLAPLGVVTGDLVKAVMLAREQRNKQAGVVASVIVDRVIGLYMIFLVATVAILATGYWRYQIENIDRICFVVFAITACATAGILAVLALNAATSQLLRLLHRIPRVGAPIAHVLEDLRLYRHRLGALFTASLITVVVHSCSSISFYLIARGLPGQIPPLDMHFVIVPLSISLGAIPLPMGPMEYGLNFFYMHLPMCEAIVEGQGLLVVLVGRLNGIILALLGVLLNLGHRRELAEAIHAGEAEPASEGPVDTSVA